MNDKSTFTRRLVDASGEFAPQVPCGIAHFATQRIDAPPALRSLHHLGGGHFVLPGEALQGHRLG